MDCLFLPISSPQLFLLFLGPFHSLALSLLSYAPFMAIEVCVIVAPIPAFWALSPFSHLPPLHAPAHFRTVSFLPPVRMRTFLPHDQPFPTLGSLFLSSPSPLQGSPPTSPRPGRPWLVFLSSSSAFTPPDLFFPPSDSFPYGSVFSVVLYSPRLPASLFLPPLTYCVLSLFLLVPATTPAGFSLSFPGARLSPPLNMPGVLPHALTDIPLSPPWGLNIFFVYAT